MKNGKVSVFYSYSHKDERYREELQAHLAILIRNGLISEWHDRKINAGDYWEKEIDSNIESADLIIALISSDFIASDYCYSKEIELALERHEKNDAVLIPIIIRTCNWGDAPFSKIQALPKDAKAVSSWPDSDEAWVNVAQGIKKAVEKIHSYKNRKGEGKGFSGINDILRKEINRIDDAFNSDLPFTGLSTGLPHLDYYIDGIHKGQLTVIASRPNHGSDNLARQIAGHIAITEKRSVCYFSMALPADHLIRQLIATEGKIQLSRLLRGDLEEDDWPKLTTSVNILRDIPLYIDESTAITFTEILKNIRKAHEDYGLELVVIEDLQSLESRNEEEGCFTLIEDRASKLKLLARELCIAIIAVSTLTRSLEERPSKRPIERDLDIWPNLDDMADTLIFTYRDFLYNEDTEFPGRVEVLIPKNINGSVGLLHFEYIEESKSFGEIISFI